MKTYTQQSVKICSSEVQSIKTGRINPQGADRQVMEAKQGGLNKAHKTIIINADLEAIYCKVAYSINLKENRAETQRNERRNKR